MDEYMKFNRRRVEDRQIDTLVGLSKGLIADGKLVQAEVEFLQTWLVQSKECTGNPIIVNLLDRIDTILRDGFVDADESAELLATLRAFAGEEAALGESARTTSLPVNQPPVPVLFSGHSFLFTGTFNYGIRRICEESTIRLGGSIANGVTKKLDYLVLGAYVTDSWAHETFGRKIEKAVEYRTSGVPLDLPGNFGPVEA